MTETYNDIDILKGLEPIQQRPELHIGSVDDPTHLWEEVFTNSVDEALSGYAENIIIKIDEKENLITIIDDGRGIPTRKKNGIPIPILVSTVMNSSAKLKKNVSAYKLSGGLHGIGLVAVCALSDNMKIISRRNQKFYEYNINIKYNTGKFDWTEKITKYTEDPKNFLTGTSISFKPCKKMFRSIYLNKNYILDRVKFISLLVNINCVLMWNNEIIFNYNDKIKNKNELLLNHIKSKFKDSSNCTDIINITCNNKSDKEEKIDIYFYYDLIKNEPLYSSNINLLPCDQGTHISYLKNLISNTLKKIIKDKTLQLSDYLIGLRCYANIYLTDPRFSGQSKEKLTIDLKHFENNFLQLEELISKKLLSDKNLLNNLKNKFIEYRQKLDIKKSLKSKKSKKSIISLQLKDCINDNGWLFIVEGESAGGSLAQCRNKYKHAIYQLKGKAILNVETNSIARILSNVSVKDLLNCINLYNITNSGKLIKTNKASKYSKIISLADADEDGFHIHTLIIKFVKKFMPELIDNRQFFIAKTPLYGYTKGKKFIPIWDENEAIKLMKKNIHITRHKGLGEFNPEELEEVLFNQGNWIEVTW